MSRVVTLLALLMVVAVTGWGYTINLLAYGQPYSLYNTGVDNLGNALTGNVQDPHYTDNNWGGDNFTFASRHPAWRSDITIGSNQVRWISPANGSTPPSVPAGTIYFSTSFTLPTDFPAWDIALNAFVWADNDPNRISLMDGATELAFVVPPQPDRNGECGYKGPGSPTTSCSSGQSYSGGPNFLAYNGLIGGRTYTIRFEVINQGTSNNPAGLWVQWDSATATGVPEPSTYAFMATVGFALYFLRRRKAGSKIS